MLYVQHGINKYEIYKQSSVNSKKSKRLIYFSISINCYDQSSVVISMSDTMVSEFQSSSVLSLTLGNKLLPLTMCLQRLLKLHLNKNETISEKKSEITKQQKEHR